MKGMVLLYTIAEVIANILCESDPRNNDQSIVQGVATKIGFPPTVLKVFIKGDIQPEEIEKLLSIYTRQDKVPSDSDLTRNRRNSITDYIGKLYSYNNLFRPYRSIFRGFKQSQTTKTPWLKKFLRGARVEPKTESFWGMALGAHTFSPFARPLAQTRLPYHRIRNQQRIDRLLGITSNYGNVLAIHGETNPYKWIKNQEKFDQILGQAKSEEKTTGIGDQNQNATTRKAFHKAPQDVAGLKNYTFFPHLHAATTPRRLKFCEKQCADEPEEARTKRPGSTGQPRPGSSGGQGSTSADGKTPPVEQNSSADECTTTKKCTCTINARCDDYLCDGAEVDKNCKGRGANNDDSAVTKNVAQTKVTTFKVTTSKYTRSKERRPTGPVWTLPPNSVLDQVKTTEEQRRTLPATKETPEGRTELTSTAEYTNAALPTQRSTSLGSTASPERIGAVSEVNGQSRSSCEQGNPTKQMLCIPMPIPTRIRIPYCHNTQKSTKLFTSKRTTPPAKDHDCTSPPDLCDCQSTKPPSAEMPISVGDSLDDNNTPNENKKGKPQKIIVRISAALGEVPVVIMRDNGVSGVSLSLVNDYLLDENNRLIKCLGQKPLRGRMDLNTRNSSVKPRANGYKSRHFFPHIIRHQLHGLQPKRYSFSVKYKPLHRLVSRPRGSLTDGNPIVIPNPALNPSQYSGTGLSNQFPSYKLNSPEFQVNGLSSFGLQYPAMQNPRSYQSFQIGPSGARPDTVGQSIRQIDLNGFPSRNDISPTEYPRFKFHPGIAPGGMSLCGFEPPGLSLQPGFPQQAAETSQLLGYRPPFLPLFYPNKNDVQPQKYIIDGLQ